MVTTAGGLYSPDGDYWMIKTIRSTQWEKGKRTISPRKTTLLQGKWKENKVHSSSLANERLSLWEGTDKRGSRGNLLGQKGHIETDTFKNSFYI